MLGILCGFAAEKKIAKKLSPLVACSGAREENARLQALALVRNGASALLSFGVAGGLADGLTPDNIVIGTRVVDKHGKSWNCDPDLVARLHNAAPHAKTGGVYGSPVIIDTAAFKQKLFSETQSVIVDMESHAVAETAAAHGLPFAVLRGISDDADAPLPEAVLHGINPDGSENIPAILKSLMKDPRQLPSLLHFARNTGTALRHLERVINRVQQNTGTMAQEKNAA